MANQVIKNLTILKTFQESAQQLGKWWIDGVGAGGSVATTDATFHNNESLMMKSKFGNIDPLHLAHYNFQKSMLATNLRPRSRASSISL